MQVSANSTAFSKNRSLIKSKVREEKRDVMDNWYEVNFTSRKTVYKPLFWYAKGGDDIIELDGKN